ncbi:MAG: tyrosine-protein phosphatase [Lapillicoccus sp.]
MTSPYSPQWLDVDGVVNMRDVGGMPTLGGGVIASGRLIRSDNLQELPPASVRRLVDELHVTDIVDLRTAVEVAAEGDGPLLAEPRVRVRHLSLFTEDTVESGIPAGEQVLPWERSTGRADSAAETAETGIPAAPSAPERHGVDEDRDDRHDAYWSSHYLGYLRQRPDSVVAALRTVATSRGATIVHCAAGKDRTGTVVGIALLLAGADPEAVVADFALSAERVPQIMARLSRRPAYAANLVGKTVDQQSPRADTMRRLITALGTLESGGGLEAWLSRHGWTDHDTAALRARLRTA